MCPFGMKTAIIGPGAMGCLFAAYLKDGGMDVTLVDNLSDRARKLEQQGLAIEGVRGEYHVSVPVTTDARALGPVDLILVCVKAYDTEEALQQHRSLVGENTTVCSFQNGLGNVEAMARVVAEQRIVGGSTTLGATEIGPGRIHHAGDGDTFVGELPGGSSPRVERIAEALGEVGLAVQVHPDIRRVIWTKLLVNVGINALTAILRVRNGVLLGHQPARRLMEAAVHEGVRAAAGQGVQLDESEIQARVKEVAARTGKNRSSMLQDILAGRRTEIDHINGAITRLDEAPVNSALTDLVRALELTLPSRERATET